MIVEIFLYRNIHLRCAQKIVSQLERGQDRDNNNTQVRDRIFHVSQISGTTFFTRTVTLTPRITITCIRTNYPGLQLRLPMSNSRNLSLLKIVKGCISKLKFQSYHFIFIRYFSELERHIIIIYFHIWKLESLFHYKY